MRFHVSPVGSRVFQRPDEQRENEASYEKVCEHAQRLIVNVNSTFSGRERSFGALGELCDDHWSCGGRGTPCGQQRAVNGFGTLEPSDVARMRRQRCDLE